MHTEESLEAMGTSAFLDLIDQLDRLDAINVLSFLMGGAPEALAAALNHAADMHGEPERIPWPTGFCGHPVHPGAWALGLHRCRECLEQENAVTPLAPAAGERT